MKSRIEIEVRELMFRDFNRLVQLPSFYHDEREPNRQHHGDGQADPQKNRRPDRAPLSLASCLYDGIRFRGDEASRPTKDMRLAEFV